MFGRNHRENCGAIEARIVRVIDEHEEILETMTDEEIMAFGIVYGGNRPYGRFTREWASKVVTQAARAKLTGMIAAWCMRSNDLNEIDQYLRYFVPEAPRQDKVLLGGDKDAPPVDVNHTHTVMTAGELVAKLIDDVGSRFSRGLPGAAEKLGKPGVETP
jgi:hypothetical protein